MNGNAGGYNARTASTTRVSHGSTQTLTCIALPSNTNRSFRTAERYWKHQCCPPCAAYRYRHRKNPDAVKNPNKVDYLPEDADTRYPEEVQRLQASVLFLSCGFYEFVSNQRLCLFRKQMLCWRQACMAKTKRSVQVPIACLIRVITCLSDHACLLAKSCPPLSSSASGYHTPIRSIQATHRDERPTSGESTKLPAQ